MTVPFDARPVLAEIDLTAVTENLTRVRELTGSGRKIIPAVKADAYGHGVVPVSRHLQALGVDGIATANVDDAVSARAAGISLPILIYGAQLPSGNEALLDHGLTPTIYDRAGLDSVDALGRARGHPVAVHVKVDAGLGRLGVRLNEAAGFLAEALSRDGVALEGVYTHIPFSSTDGADWSACRLAAFADMLGSVEDMHGIDIPIKQASASSLLSARVPDRLNTVAPGHLIFGLSPLSDVPPAEIGVRPALVSLRAKLIHVADRHTGDDLAGGSAAAGRTGVILFGMDNGFRPAPAGKTAHVLCRGVRCPVTSVSAEYACIDLSALPDAVVGDDVTIIGNDGDTGQTVEDLAADLGAPSAAYWLVGLKRIPTRYSDDGS